MWCSPFFEGPEKKDRDGTPTTDFQAPPLPLLSLMKSIPQGRARGLVDSSPLYFSELIRRAEVSP